MLHFIEQSSIRNICVSHMRSIYTSNSNPHFSVTILRILCTLNTDIVSSSYLHNLRSEISGGAAEDEVSVRERECEPVLLALLEAI